MNLHLEEGLYTKSAVMHGSILVYSKRLEYLGFDKRETKKNSEPPMGIEPINSRKQVGRTSLSDLLGDSWRARSDLLVSM